MGADRTHGERTLGMTVMCAMVPLLQAGHRCTSNPVMWATRCCLVTAGAGNSVGVPFPNYTPPFKPSRFSAALRVFHQKSTDKDTDIALILSDSQ